MIALPPPRLPRASFLLVVCAALVLSCATTTTTTKKKSRSHRSARRPPAAAVVEEPKSPAPEAPPEQPTTEPAFLDQGLASFYADSLAGNRTASGERYSPDEPTCAHRKLPFGTWLRVTVVASGKSALCRVNDRGPFVNDRILDVSRAVAERLSMVKKGVAEVRIEAVEAP